MKGESLSMIDFKAINPVTGMGVPVFLEGQAPLVDRDEVLRYAGIASKEMRAGLGGDDPLDELYDDVMEQCRGVFSYRLGYRHISLMKDVGMSPSGYDESQAAAAGMSGMPLLAYFKRSKNLMKSLSRCDEVIVFAATVGAGIDRLIKRYERNEPARALMLQALGAERVEALCDMFEYELRSDANAAGYKMYPRYSPGYGDLSIEVQTEMLRVLDAERRLGITLSQSYLMSPSKSVTAVIGLGR